MKRCEKCGKQNETDDLFCADCGASLPSLSGGEPGYPPQSQNGAPGYPSQPQGWTPGYPSQPQGWTPGYPSQPQGWTPGYPSQPLNTALWPNAQDEATSGGRSFLVCFQKFCCFRGRATRGEFWSWTGWNALINVFLLGLCALCAVLAKDFYSEYDWSRDYSVTDYAALDNSRVLGVLACIFGGAFGLWQLLTALPGLSVSVRRLHDSNLSGGHYCWVFLPVVGGIVLLAQLLRSSTRGPNRFGLEPDRNSRAAWPATQDEAVSGFRALNACFRKFFRVRGRATRGEYWSWFLWTGLIGVVLSGLSVFYALKSGGAYYELAATNFRADYPWHNDAFTASVIFYVASQLWQLLTMFPGLAVLARRLHDSNLSFGHYFWTLVPVVGWIILLAQLLRPSTRGPNRFGMEPFKKA